MKIERERALSRETKHEVNKDLRAFEAAKNS